MGLVETKLWVAVGGRVAGTILVLEALYFVCVTIYMTAFGISLASSPAYTKSFLEVSSLPVVAVGAFALLALAFTHVSARPEPREQSGTVKQFWAQPSTWGFVAVVLVHLGLGIWFVSQGGSRIGPSLLVLAGLLSLCAVLQSRVLRTDSAASDRALKPSAHGETSFTL